MRRFVLTMVAALALGLAVALPAAAGAKTGQVLWICDPDGQGPEPEKTFVSAPAAAAHGINTANAHAGQTFHLRFGEVCRVEVLWD